VPKQASHFLTLCDDSGKADAHEHKHSCLFRITDDAIRKLNVSEFVSRLSRAKEMSVITEENQSSTTTKLVQSPAGYTCQWALCKLENVLEA
jgi:hypothetical protein